MATILDLDAMLDATLDNVEDVPDYQNPPNGLYRLRIKDSGLDSYEKDGEKKTRIKNTFEVVQTIETEDVPVADGTLFTETFTGTEDGLKYFKKSAKAYLNVSSLDGVPLREVFASLTGVEFQAKITISKSTSNGKEYENVRIRAVSDTEDAA